MRNLSMRDHTRDIGLAIEHKYKEHEPIKRSAHKYQKNNGCRRATLHIRHYDEGVKYAFVVLTKAQGTHSAV
jgi:hypothetical protein